jgi:hypothetical protein
MLHYLTDLDRIRRDDYDYDYNWSVWDHDQIHEGDRFFWVKVGMYGQTGIVASGKITSEPYRDEDWSGKNRETFYVDFVPDVLINPDALPVLSCAELAQIIPDFEWEKGHSGLVLNDEQAKKLEEVWADFLAKNKIPFTEAKNKRFQEDLVYLSL